MTVTVSIRVQTRAAHNAIDGFRDGVLRLRVTAAPSGGEANEAVVNLLAKELGIGTGRVTIVRGHSSRQKTLAIEGVTMHDLQARLGAA